MGTTINNHTATEPTGQKNHLQAYENYLKAYGNYPKAYESYRKAHENHLGAHESDLKAQEKYLKHYEIISTPMKTKVDGKYLKAHKNPPWRWRHTG